MSNSETNAPTSRAANYQAGRPHCAPHPDGRQTPSAIRRPELLAPAGDWDCAKAAVENGADAIYFGLERFNARMRAHNFTEADLPKLMEFLHRRGVRGYVSFNTLVFANEMAEAENSLRAIIAAGVDAAIVQDVGICRLIRQLSLDFPIHASTQMTVTSAAGVEFARELGCQLVVLARECSIKEIEKIQLALAPPISNLKSQISNLPLEVFVHGALCVAYSGQCLTSEALGGRSANRGECAQACRMPYELICDGQPVPLGDRRYLLSPRDLAGLELLPDLARAGVASLKIEGRLKTPEYVANITRIYRQALDRLATDNGQLTADEASKRASGHVPLVTRHTQYDLEMAFSRGLSTGWLGGTNNQELVHARFGKKRGVFLGEVSRVQGDTVFLTLEGPLKPGDGVVFDAGHPEQEEEGGRVYEVRKQKGNGGKAMETALTFGRGDVNFQRIQAGHKLWKTSDPQLDRRLRQTFAGKTPRFQRPLQLEVHGAAGQPMTVMARDEVGLMVQAASAMPLAGAENQPLTLERLREQLGRLGGTPFKLGALRNWLEGSVVLPFSELNRLRRELVRQLEQLRAQPLRWTLDCGLRIADCGLVTGDSAVVGKTAPPSAELIVLVRSLPQLEAVLRCGVRTVYCEFEDPKKYRDAVQRFREWAKAASSPVPPTASNCLPSPITHHPSSVIRHPSSVTHHPSPITHHPLPATNNAVQSEISNLKSQIFVAPPRIFKTGEDWILKQVLSSEADGYLVRNYDHLKFFAGCRRIGDYSLNVANALAAGLFMNRYGLERVTASYDLNILQLEALLQSAPPDWFEITIHQHIPMFHMEHCVFCAFLSTGTDYTNCGRPCDRHEVGLRDRVGAEHPLKADSGCRNTVFNALAQTGAEGVARLLALGARRFRIEFLNETPEQAAQIILKYAQLLRGKISGTQLWRELKLLNQLGVTRGQMPQTS
ncbi:MAG: U32 family peptidase [Verrucomicrobiota bacterium]